MSHVLKVISTGDSFIRNHSSNLQIVINFVNKEFCANWSAADLRDTLYSGIGTVLMSGSVNMGKNLTTRQEVVFPTLDKTHPLLLVTSHQLHTLAIIPDILVVSF